MKKNPTITIRGALLPHTSYGQLMIEFSTALAAFGYEVHVRPTTTSNPHNVELPSDFIRLLRDPGESSEFSILFAPPSTPITHPNTIVFTMNESTALSEKQVERLNKARCVVVPCAWVKDNFDLQLEPTVAVVPLGIDPYTFSPRPMVLDDYCTFVVVGRFAGPGARKNLHLAVLAFKRAFPEEKDARLIIKCHPGEAFLVEKDDDRISVINQYLTNARMADLYAASTAALHPSAGEAWGLVMHQAMAVGRPVISPVIGGPKTFLEAENCYPVMWNWANSVGLKLDSYYEGQMLEIDLASLVYEMRRVYFDRELARRKGVTAAAMAHKFSWYRSAEALLKVLEYVSFL